MKFNNSDEGVSEIIGTILLLSIVVGVFGIVYMTVFNYEFSEMKPTTQLSTTIEGQNLIFEHQRGTELTTDSLIIINLNGNRINCTIADLMRPQDKADNRWSIGEQATYHAGIDLSTQTIRAFIIDKTTSFTYDSGEIL